MSATKQTKGQGTPGPWRAQRELRGNDRIDVPYYEIVMKSEHESGYIAAVDGMRGECQAANARIISTAPDGVELARAVVAMAGFKDNLDADTSEIVDIAQRIIAAVEGEK
jgi:hypothetical protein